MSAARWLSSNPLLPDPTTQQRVATGFFNDGSVELAAPPLRALLHVMAHGQYNGKTAADPEIRKMFTREYLLASDWYAKRLKTKQERDLVLWGRHVKYLEEFVASRANAQDAARLGVEKRLAAARGELGRVASEEYLRGLVGTVGADPMR